MSEAARLLGRPHRIEGTVMTGVGRGRSLDAPTANLSASKEMAIPRAGIYVTTSTVDGGEVHPSVTSLGTNPTFESDRKMRIETLLLDFSGDLYGRHLAVDFLERIRGQKTFPDADSLARADQAGCGDRPRRACEEPRRGLLMGRMGSRRMTRSPARSRIPAVTVLLLVVLVLTGVGLALAYAPGPAGQNPTGASFGLQARFGAGGGGSGYSEAELAALSGPLPANPVRVHVPVLMYHYVDDEPPPAGPYADGLTVRTPDFVEEMEYLVANGYQAVTLADVYLAMAGIRQLPAKCVALTFDDGGLDNYTVAFPLLKEHGFAATFFVITKTVGAEGQMDWDQLREMAEAGMSIQSHSISHPDLTGVSDERLKTELVDSRNAIAEAVGEPGYVLSYPAGSHDERVMEAARAAGYVMAVATDDGAELDPDSVFEITRKRIQAFMSIDTFARLVD